MKYAIVDIETTGGTRKSRGITEVAVVVSDGQQVVDTWSSLINPFEPIPPRISALTGITDDMVEDAPGFDEVAEELMGKLEDCVFVAHNVGFDYAFLRGHFEAMDISFRRPKLCTVRLSRKAFPGLPGMDLGRSATPWTSPTPTDTGRSGTPKRLRCSFTRSWPRNAANSPWPTR